VDNYHEREIKYEGFGGRPSVGGRPGALVPGPPLNPALAYHKLCRSLPAVYVAMSALHEMHIAPFD